MKTRLILVSALLGSLLATAAVLSNPVDASALPPGCIEWDGQVECSAELCASNPDAQRNEQIDFTAIDDSRVRAPFEGGSLLAQESRACGTFSICTGAIIARNPNTNKRYGVTAGHCLRDADESINSNPVTDWDGATLGWTSTRASRDGDPHDVGKILLKNQWRAYHNRNKVIVGNRNFILNTTIPTANQTRGLEMCHGGIATSSYMPRPFDSTQSYWRDVCGPIETVDYDTSSYESLICFRAIANHGDSGGPVFRKRPNERINVAGIISSVIFETSWRGNVQWDKPALICYTPIDRALDYLDLVI